MLITIKPIEIIVEEDYYLYQSKFVMILGKIVNFLEFKTQ